MNKIIQLEKQRQGNIRFSGNKLWEEMHKDFLINLKEYMEKNLKILYTDTGDEICLTEDIEELNKMIKKYG